MKFPVIVTYRQAKATIYGLKTPDGRAKKYPCYRLADRIDGKRHVQNLKTLRRGQGRRLETVPLSVRDVPGTCSSFRTGRP